MAQLVEDGRVSKMELTTIDSRRPPIDWHPPSNGFQTGYRGLTLR
jgi:hypothetical protein